MVLSLKTTIFSPALNMKLIVLFAKINICFLHESKLKSRFVFQELCLSALNHTSERRHLAVVSWKATLLCLTSNSKLQRILKVQVIPKITPKNKPNMKIREDTLHNTCGVEQITLSWKRKIFTTAKTSLPLLMWKVIQIEGQFCCFTEESKFYTSNYKVSAAKLFVQQDNFLGIPMRQKKKKKGRNSNCVIKI